MKLNKIYQRNILILSILIIITLTSLSFFYTQDIRTIFEDTNPSQKTTDNRCRNFDKVVKIFKDYIPQDTPYLDKSNRFDWVYIKTSENYPSQLHPFIKSKKVELLDSKMGGILLDYTENFEQEIRKVGLKKEYTFESLNLLYIQYSQYGDIYLIQLPTSVESPVVVNNLAISCLELDKNLDSLYKRVVDQNKNTDFVEIIENKDNVIRLNIFNKDSVSGSSKYFDLTKNKAEIIYDGQDLISCKLLESKKIGQGLDCN